MNDKNVQQYSDELKKFGIEHTIVEHPELKTPQEVQGYLGLTLADGLSTMIMKADDQFVAIIRRDDTRLDFGKVKKVLTAKDVRMAKPDEFTRLTGMPLGVARVYNPGLPTLLDARLFEKDLLTGGSGSFLCSFRYKTSDLTKLPASKAVDVTEVSKADNKLTEKRLLSGITPSGDGSLHIGNYLGAVQQFIELAKTTECFLMVADLHALTTVQDKKTLQQNTETLILNELSLLLGGTEGQDGREEPEKAKDIVFFRQSDVFEHTELQSILNNVTPLGLLKRAHAYKDKLSKDTMEDDINVGLFSYPMLMAADILLYKPDLVPVGRDQKQHIEITRDIAERFNKIYGGGKGSGGSRGIFKLPEAHIPEEVAVIMGTDGKRKMSKSLGNIISIFEPEEVIKKQVMGTYTDPTRVHATDPGHIEGNMVFHYLEHFGEAGEVGELGERYKAGKVSDVEVKEYLFTTLMKTFGSARERYQELKENPKKIKDILETGAEKAHAVASQTMMEVREAVGLTNSYSFFSYPEMGEVGAVGEYMTIDEFAKAEQRVGLVQEATNVDKSEKLIRLVVDFGSEVGKRIIFTGVRSFGYSPENFLNKQFFFVVNLAPKKIMNEFSQGMILAVDPTSLKLRGASGPEKPLFISAEGMPVGARIR